jgi:hypothetical protein
MRVDEDARAVDRPSDGAEPGPDQPPARGETVANEEVGLAPIEIGIEMTLGERDGKTTVRVGQRRPPRREESRGPFARHDAGCAPDVAAEGGASPIDCRRGGRHALRQRQELLAFARQAMPIRRALEQPGAHGPLELVEVPPDGRLSESQRARRLAQAAGLGDGEEDPQVVPLHAPSLAGAPAPGDYDRDVFAKGETWAGLGFLGSTTV